MIHTRGAHGFFFRFTRNRIHRHPQCIQSRCTWNRYRRTRLTFPPFLSFPLPPLYQSLCLCLCRSFSLPLSCRNEIMVIDYPTWKPPSGISITYVCIPTGNLPLIRSNSAVTQFTPASNLKWDCLMAQGTIEMGFSDFAGPRVLSGPPRRASGRWLFESNAIRIVLAFLRDRPRKK